MVRITYNSMIDNIKGAFHDNLFKLNRIQQQLSSGKNINKPSDDPINTAKISIYKTKRNQHEQFIKTIDESVSWLATTENAVDQINNAVLEIRRICVESGNGSIPDEARSSMIIKLKQLKDELISNSNSKYMDKYIFSGLDTLNKPFTESGADVLYNGDTGSMDRFIAFGASMKINIDGDKLFNISGTAIPGDPDLFNIIDNMTACLENGDIDTISNEILAQIDRAHANIIDFYSEIGSRINRLELTRSQNENNMISIDRMMSIIEDVDLAEKITELKKAEMVYQISLDVAGRIFPQTLLDYLR